MRTLRGFTETWNIYVFPQLSKRVLPRKSPKAARWVTTFFHWVITAARDPLGRGLTCATTEAPKIDTLCVVSAPFWLGTHTVGHTAFDNSHFRVTRAMVGATLEMSHTAFLCSSRWAQMCCELPPLTDVTCGNKVNLIIDQQVCGFTSYHCEPFIHWAILVVDWATRRNVINKRY